MRYIICFFLLFFISSCFSNKQQRLQKTNIANDLYDFQKYKTLDEYTNNYRNYIEKYRSGISQLDIERLAPLTRKADSSCSKKSGFILVHGLSDSPFMMSDITNSISQKNPCSIINRPILPGHALLPGASLEATNEQWISAVDLAVKDLRNSGVDSITMIGFSTGSALSLHYVLSNYNSNQDIKLALISPAFDLSLPWYKVSAIQIMSFVGNISNSSGYIDNYKDVNPYKYESFSYNGVNELRKLTKKIQKLLDKINVVNNNILLFASNEDSTINQKTTFDLSSKYFKNLSGGVIYSPSNISNVLNGVVVQNPQSATDKIVDLSHVSLPISPKNVIFGKSAKTNYGCLHYVNNDKAELLASCEAFSNDLYYGETNNENLSKYPKISRIQYNPFYDDLIEKLFKFIEN
jgi:esterase/lipase